MGDSTLGIRHDHNVGLVRVETMAFKNHSRTGMTNVLLSGAFQRCIFCCDDKQRRIYGWFVEGYRAEGLDDV